MQPDAWFLLFFPYQHPYFLPFFHLILPNIALRLKKMPGNGSTMLPDVPTIKVHFISFISRVKYRWNTLTQGISLMKCFPSCWEQTDAGPSEGQENRLWLVIRLQLPQPKFYDCFFLIADWPSSTRPWRTSTTTASWSRRSTRPSRRSTSSTPSSSPSPWPSSGEFSRVWGSCDELEWFSNPGFCLFPFTSILFGDLF